jgi:hypothetical protein
MISEMHGIPLLDLLSTFVLGAIDAITIACLLVDSATLSCIYHQSDTPSRPSMTSKTVSMCFETVLYTIQSLQYVNSTPCHQEW